MSNEHFIIEEELKKLPDQPGVYIMHDERDAIIYVGKALSLTKRVHQYFQPSHDEGLKKKQMVAHISRFEYIVTDSELEALVLENNLIKEHRPKYNTMLRDDKTYPYICVTLTEEYPRVVFSRRIKKDSNKYFGPFTSAGAVRDTIDLVNKIYHLRTCNKKFPRDFGKDRPCLNYHMDQCPGVCTGQVDAESYGESVREAMKFLDGDYKPVVKMLREKMEACSKEMEFERAATFRDLIESVMDCVEKQKITSYDGEDKDIVAAATDGEDAVVQVFFIRGGRMIGREHYFINVRIENEMSDILSVFLKQYYAGTPFIPREIYVQEEMSDEDMIEGWLSEKKGRKVTILTPKRGAKEKLVELAAKNARMVLDQDRERIKREEGRTIGAMKEIAGLIGLERIERMEAYDISNTSGYQSVGSMVVFEKGKPARSDYRKFRIKSVEGPNDYESMREVLTRRFSHGLEEIKNARGAAEDKEATLSSFSKFPDVIMMDGGKGQVNIALQVLDELGLSIPVCGMVKDDHHRTRGLFYDNVEIPIDKSGEGFKLITRLQDEAHRFAIEFHRSLRGKNQVKSFLDDIPGIGPTRRKALMRSFSGPDEMKEASVEDLMAIPEMNQKAAESVYAYFHKQ
ncbi:MAG: excinuclease ABC subunit UvrC [Lachnospiraceae bacterium]|nr:excinuclease ABC subunit UvrC [Lachnospiraceae bacterium]